MKVQIKKLRLSYFKGIKSLELDFAPEENFLHGRNASGKTTVFDAVWFLFFGKDSTGRADFSIKTLDEKNQPIEKVDHEVYAEFDIDGKTKTFQRTYKQQWTKDNQLKGHTTDYEIDGFPVRLESEYRRQVEEYFKEDLFKLLTNPLFFNSMKPADRRAVLINMASAFSNDQVFKAWGSKSKWAKKLEEILTEGATLEQIKLKAARDKKNFKDEKDAIPARIDEAERSKPEAYEFDELQEIISEKKKELTEVEAQIKELSNSNSAHNKAVQEWQNQVFEAKTKLQKLEFLAEQEFNKWQNEQNKYPQEIQAKIKDLNETARKCEESIQDLAQQIERKKANAVQFTNLIPAKEQEKSRLVEEWKTENSKEFNWNGTNCPACDRPLEGTQAMDAEEQARARFNRDKKSRIDDITRRGNQVKEQITEYQQQIERINNEIRDLSNRKNEKEIALEEIKGDLINLESAINEYYATVQEGKTANDFLSPEAKELQAKIEKLESTRPEKSEEVDTSELQSNKTSIQNSLEELQKALGNKETIERINKRIAELKAKEKELAQAIADSEGLEDACFEFGKAKVELIENEINSKFSLVSFKLFEIQLNGNEKEVCETLFKGVPFNDLNNAGKIQAGLDIINTLSKHHDTHLPIFIDNRESVTWLPSVETQLINLVVDPSEEKLTLKNQESTLIEK